MIPKNKRHLIVNKEYSRLPYWTDDGYEDVQRQVSQKYVQDTFGKFAESENQPPYLSDADYQGLEYQYQNPEFFDSTKLPDIDFKNTIPKGTCYELWVSMFGKGTGGFFPTNSQYAQLMDYAKKCPLIYMPHYCCPKGNMKISGPDKVMPGAEAEYTVTGDLDGCSYSWEAKRGRIIGGTYEAPSTPGSDTIWVTPYLSDDMGKVCAFKDITIEGGCKGKIYALITTMAAGASQTLSVTGGSEYDDYYWAATTGSLSANEGTSVVFTAPATNPNCANNPTITLTCGGVQVDSVSIAINAVPDTGGVGVMWEYLSQGSCWKSGDAWHIWNICANVYTLSCNGTVTFHPAWSPQCSNGQGVDCDAAFSDGEMRVISGLTGQTAYCYNQG